MPRGGDRGCQLQGRGGVSPSRLSGSQCPACVLGEYTHPKFILEGYWVGWKGGAAQCLLKRHCWNWETMREREVVGLGDTATAQAGCSDPGPHDRYVLT